MATFVSTIRYTQQGLAGVQETCQRAAALKSTARKMGAKITGIYWTMGPFDGLLIFEAPDDDTATALMLNVAAAGNIQTQTARAFSAPEMEKILAAMKT